jgi:hypothetical protein
MENLNLHLSGQISYKDYRNTILKMTCKKIWLPLLITTIIIISFIFTEIDISNPNFIFLAVFIVVIISFPLSIIRSTKKLYKQNKTFHEILNYHLDNEKITIDGDTVHSTQNWSRFIKVKETSTFFLLHQDNVVANWLDKKMFTNEELIEFRKFLNSLNIKKELKKK